jgi:hypothetical protein
LPQAAATELLLHAPAAVAGLGAVFLAGVDVAHVHDERDVGILVDRVDAGRIGQELCGVGRRGAVGHVADDRDGGFRVRAAAAGGEQCGNSCGFRPPFRRAGVIAFAQPIQVQERAMPTLPLQPIHEAIVASLAAQFEAPVDDVASLYQSEWAELAAEARVTQYLHIFALRHVRDILSKRAAHHPH